MFISEAPSSPTEKRPLIDDEPVRKNPVHDGEPVRKNSSTGDVMPSDRWQHPKVQVLLSRFHNIEPSGVGKKVICPSHPDVVASLTIDLDLVAGRILLCCHAGCDTATILKALGYTKENGEPDWSALFLHELIGGRRCIAKYDYIDEHGRLLYQKLRFEPKTFSLRQPTPQGDWYPMLSPGLRRVVYHLDEIQGQPVVFIPEGEKDVDRLRSIGLIATCNDSGASKNSQRPKWMAAHSSQLKEAGVESIVVLADNDDAGRAHAASVAQSCTAAGMQAKVIHLAGLTEHGDVSDWLDRGHTRHELETIVAAAPVVECEAGAAPATVAAQQQDDEDAERRLRSFNVDQQQHSKIRDAVIQEIIEQNDPPSLYINGGALVEVRTVDDQCKLHPFLTPGDLINVLYDLAYWWRGTKQVKATEPPAGIARAILEHKNLQKLPALNRIVECPVFGPDGRFQTRPGYHPSSRTYYAPKPGFVVPDVPESPSPAEINRAKSLILDDVFVDFPFDGPVNGQAERAHAVALMLLPFSRNLINGPTPLHLSEAPTPGTGKTLLVEMALYPALGRLIQRAVEATNSDEWRKKLFAILLEGPAAILIDNVQEHVKSGALSAGLRAIPPTTESSVSRRWRSQSIWRSGQ